MRVLAVETATAQGSVAVVGPHGVLAERSARVAGEHLEWLMSAIAEVLSDARLPVDEIDGLAVSIGPGGFMGLRVGLMTASTWAAATGRPLVGISTLEVIAAGVADQAGPSPTAAGLVLAAIDARRGEVAAALFRCGPPRDLAPARLTPDVLTPPSAIGDRLPVITEPLVVAGDALERHHAAITGALAPWATPAPHDRWSPRASVGGVLGRIRLLRGDRDDPLHLVPHYAREPDAKEFAP